MLVARDRRLAGVFGAVRACCDFRGAAGPGSLAVCGPARTGCCLPFVSPRSARAGGRSQRRPRRASGCQGACRPDRLGCVNEIVPERFRLPEGVGGDDMQARRPVADNEVLRRRVAGASPRSRTLAWRPDRPDEGDLRGVQPDRPGTAPDPRDRAAAPRQRPVDGGRRAAARLEPEQAVPAGERPLQDQHRRPGGHARPVRGPLAAAARR